MKRFKKIEFITLVSFLVFMGLVACQRAKPTKEEGLFSGWKLHVFPEERYQIQAPEKSTSDVLKVPSEEGEKKVPVTYFKVDNNIFYVGSSPRDPKLTGDDGRILESQAAGILSRFQKFEVKKEFFENKGLRGLRMELTRPDSFKIIELYVTPARMYQVVTDLPSPESYRKESERFRSSFAILER